MWPNSQETADLVKFTEKIFNGKLYFLCSEKDSGYGKSNYIPVSVLPILSKLFENVIYHQISKNFEYILSQYHTGLPKDYNEKTNLLVMIKKFRKSLDEGAALQP